MMRLDPVGAGGDGASASGLAHGALVWPAWAVALLGALCVLIGLTYFALRLYGARRGKV